MTSSEGNMRWALKMQPIAISQIYSQVWPDCEVIELDDDSRNSLKKMLDIAGSDKLLRYPNGSIAFLAQRFRACKYLAFDDFTIRESLPRSGRTTELEKSLLGIKEGRMVAAFYAYGHVNLNENGFEKFRILNYPQFLRMYLNNELPRPRRECNRNGGSTFLAWSFSELPDSVIFWQMTNSGVEIEQEQYTPLEDFI